MIGARAIEPVDCALAYHRWLVARARLYESGKSDDETEAAFDAEDEAVIALASAPSRLPEDVHHKLEALSVYVTETVLAGKRTIPIEPYLVSAIQSDLLRLGLGNEAKE